MSAHHPRRRPHPHARTTEPASRLRRVTTAALAVSIGLLALVTSIPAASAAILRPDPDGFGGITVPLTPVPHPRARVVTIGGMPGWQIVLIVLGAAVAAVMLDRLLTARPAWAAINARRFRPAQAEHRPGVHIAGHAASDQDTPVPLAGSAPETSDMVQFGPSLIR